MPQRQREICRAIAVTGDLVTSALAVGCPHRVHEHSVQLTQIGQRVRIEQPRADPVQGSVAAGSWRHVGRSDELHHSARAEAGAPVTNDEL